MKPRACRTFRNSDLYMLIAVGDHAPVLSSAGLGSRDRLAGRSSNSKVGATKGKGEMKAIGTMSGTSIDGVDVALIETDGERIVSLGPSGYRPYSAAERATLRQALSEAVHLTV